MNTGETFATALIGAIALVLFVVWMMLGMGVML